MVTIGQCDLSYVRIGIAFERVGASEKNRSAPRQDGRG